MHITQLVIPLITLFTDPECGRQADWSHAIIAMRERGWSSSALTAIPVAALANGQVELDDAREAVESILSVWQWKVSSWESRIVAYERCLERGGEDAD